MTYVSTYNQPVLYVPQTLSEIHDYLAGTMGNAPSFVDRTGFMPEHNIDREFEGLLKGVELNRKKLGEERYTRLIDLAARMKAAFAADPEDKNGQANEGFRLLNQFEDEIQDARRRRSKAKLKDDEGEVTGD